MAITQQQAEVVARSMVNAYERSQDRNDELSDHRVSRGLWQAAMEAMHRVAQSASDDETLLDVQPSYSYKSAISVSVSVTLLVATDRRLWVARHEDGVAQEPMDVAYEAIRPVGKLISVSTKIEHRPEGVVITGSRSLAEWLQALQLQRPTSTAAWLAGSPSVATAPAQTPAGWHADPTARHLMRYWDGARWTEHVSDNGVAALDPIA